jgi:hypothetical protein
MDHGRAGSMITDKVGVPCRRSLQAMRRSRLSQARTLGQREHGRRAVVTAPSMIAGSR